MCFSPYLGVGRGGGGVPRDLEHNLLMQFSRLSSSKKVVPLRSSRCFAEGNRIFQGAERAEDDLHCATVVQFVLQSPPPPPKGGDCPFVTVPHPLWGNRHDIGGGMQGGGGKA